MKNLIPFLMILFSVQLAYTQNKCGQKSIIGTWTENQSILTAMLANPQAYKFNENGTVVIYVLDPEKQEFIEFAKGKYKLDNQDNPSAITFYGMSISIFQTEGEFTVKLVNLSETLLEWEGLFGINLELSRVYEHDKVDFKVPNVSAISQVNYQTCWASCAAMLFSWRKKKVHPPFTIFEALTEIEKFTPVSERKFLKIWMESTDGNEAKGISPKGGIGDNDADELFFKKMGLTSFDMQNSNRCFKEKLERSPILLRRTPKGSNIRHVLIMAGVVGDGTPEGTYFWIIDPWEWNNELTKTPQSITLPRKVPFEELFGGDYDVKFAYYSN